MRLKMFNDVNRRQALKLILIKTASLWNLYCVHNQSAPLLSENSVLIIRTWQQKGGRKKYTDKILRWGTPQFYVFYQISKGKRIRATLIRAGKARVGDDKFVQNFGLQDRVEGRMWHTACRTVCPKLSVMRAEW